MARTESTMFLAIGALAPAFSLPDFSDRGSPGRVVSLEDVAQGRPFVVMFICNHCPFVKHVQPELVRLAHDYSGKAEFVAISSNDAAGYPDDRPELMSAEASAAGYTFPYLYDESQAVAKAYFAACTPDFYLFDKNRKLAYRGQLDDSRPGNGLQLTGKDLRVALNQVLAGKEAPLPQFPSVGCNIKWKKGNEPEYFLNPR